MWFKMKEKFNKLVNEYDINPKNPKNVFAKNVNSIYEVRNTGIGGKVSSNTNNSTNVRNINNHRNKLDKIVLGLDEAGRGPVLGPMVMALVKSSAKDLDRFNDLGVKDSKRLSKNRREKLYNYIMENYEVKTLILEAKTIDDMMKKISLNKIELMGFSRLINNILKKEYGGFRHLHSRNMTYGAKSRGSDTFNNINDDKTGSFNDSLSDKLIEIYIDACSSNERAFSNQIKSKLVIYNKNIKIIAEHKADDKYKIVSAASIVAKVIRDKIIDNYKKIYGDIGSGYPSDKITVNYLENYVKKHGVLPEIARKSWKTSKNILKKYEDELDNHCKLDKDIDINININNKKSKNFKNMSSKKYIQKKLIN